MLRRTETTVMQSRLNVFWGPWARRADGAPPSLFPFLPSPPLSISLLFPPLPSPPLPLEVDPLNPARGSGERCKLPAKIEFGAF